MERTGLDELHSDTTFGHNIVEKGLRRQNGFLKSLPGDPYGGYRSLAKTFDDNFIPGLVVGGISGTLINFVEIVLIDWLKFGQIRFMDYAGLLAYGRQFYGFPENLLAFFIQVGLSATLGVLFIYIIDRVSTKDLLLKGIFFALNFWYFIFTLVLLFKVPYVLVVTFKGAAENLLSSSLFGVFLAESYQMIYLRKNRWGRSNS